MRDENKMSIRELESLEGVRIDIDRNINVNEGICPRCNEKMIKYVDNKNLFDGMITLHIIKFRCLKCKKEYLDLDEAQKYDLFLKLEKIGKDKALALISKNTIKQLYA